MSWFQLDPRSLADRAAASGPGSSPLSLPASVMLGSIGFCVVSIAGFVPWAIFGRDLGRVIGEAGMYAVCALVFIGLAGLFLHRLLIGEGSLVRFYKVFSIAFGAYSVAWIAGWMALRGHAGSVVGLLAGTALMGWIFTRAFDARNALGPIVAALFLANAAGYFIGGWIEGGLMNAENLQFLGQPLPRRSQMRVAMLAWGVFYGLGLGAGLGYAFHRCQRAARELLRDRLTRPPQPADPE
ncbi:MAG: hypothetical protein IT581_10100 [Verrucomicrobiales bacterium]|nr:hypothetical protein [Verrucomicrobiales bacterium]